MCGSYDWITALVMDRVKIRVKEKASVKNTVKRWLN